MSKPVLEFFVQDGIVTSLSQCRPMNEEEIVTLEQRVKELVDNSLEICVTFKPLLQSMYNSNTLTDIVSNLLKKIHKKHDMELILIGEFSDSGMYHMHGLVKADGRTINIIKRNLTRDIGRVKIGMIKYTESYAKYIMKDVHKTRRIYSSEVVSIRTLKVTI